MFSGAEVAVASTVDEGRISVGAMVAVACGISVAGKVGAAVGVK